MTASDLRSSPVQPVRPLPHGLAVEICERLGTSLPTSLADVDDVYRKWVGHVPFEPTTKVLALRAGEVPPGDDPVGFCEQWLATGVGGLCWPHVTGLASLLSTAGVETSIGLDRMLVEHVDFHAFVVVRDGGRDYAADTVHLSDRLVPMEPGEEGSHPHYRSGFVEEDGRLVHWFVHPRHDGPPVRYSVLSTVLGLDDVRAFCELSIAHSGVGAKRFWSRLAPEGSFLEARPTDDGAKLATSTWHDGGVAIREDDPLAGLKQLGMADDGIAMVERAGLLVLDDRAAPQFVLPRTD